MKLVGSVAAACDGGVTLVELRRVESFAAKRIDQTVSQNGLETAVDAQVRGVEKHFWHMQQDNLSARSLRSDCFLLRALG